ncbi:MAG: glycosyltransferase [Candidatus Binataceae bacterium]
MTLTVLNVAYPFSPVGPDAVGGAEQVLRMIDRALVGAGHCSIVIAQAGSLTAGRLLPIPLCDCVIGHSERNSIYQTCREAIEGVLEHSHVDIVHMHGVDFTHYFSSCELPTLVTLHLPFHAYQPGAFEHISPHMVFNFVSTSQQQLFSHTLSSDLVIQNGVPLDLSDPGVRKRNYALALGRICPEKGYHHALEAALRARAPLLLAGKVFPYADHQTYFREQIAPRLDADRLFIGPLSLAQKREALTAARCLLIPSVIPETSSLAAMEALACGTPVIAFRSGALVDIVEEGITGFLVSDVKQMAEAIGAAGYIDSDVCRARARERFSGRRMTDQYLALYADLAAS